MRMIIFVVAFLFVVSLASADVGPGPTAPEITVVLQGDVNDIHNITHITYHCEGTNSTGSGAVEPSVRDFTCKNITCTTSGWYYKFNPCFYSSGYFSYELDGVERQSTWLNFTEGRQYSVVINTDTGEARTTPSGCLGTALIMGILGIAGFIARRNSG